jgi:hypothetical protein
LKIIPSPLDQSFIPDTLLSMRHSEPVSTEVRVHRVGPGRVAVELRKGRVIDYAQLDTATARAMAAALIACADAQD